MRSLQFVLAFLLSAMALSLLQCKQVSASQATDCPHLQPGLIPVSQLAEWTTATNATDLTIQSGQKVLLDTDVELRNLVISVGAELIFDDKAGMLLSVESLRVDGALRAGSRSCPIKAWPSVVIQLNGMRPIPATNALGPNPSDGMTLGDKGIGVATNATLQLHGNVEGASWTRLNETILPGQTTISIVAKDVGASWRVGASIVIAGTDFGPLYDASTLARTLKAAFGTSYTPFPEQNEVFTIMAVDGNTLTLDKPIQYMHYCDQEFPNEHCAEVGLLSRSIVIQGDAKNITDQWGGQIMVRDAQIIEVDGVELTRMGQQGLVGRYPIHFHLIRNLGWQRNYYVKRCAIHHNYQRALVVHDSNGVLVQDNVAYDTNGHMYFLEDAAEELNIFDHNLGILARPVPSDTSTSLIYSGGRYYRKTVLFTDNLPSVFWVTNMNNTFINNVGVNGYFTWWFSFPPRPNGLSTSRYANDNRLLPRTLPPLEFRGNIAHSATKTCFMLDSNQGPDQKLQGGVSYAPIEDAILFDSTAFKCRDAAWQVRGHVGLRGVKIFDSSISYYSVPTGASTLLADALIVGESDNTGYFAGFPFWGNRSRPDVAPCGSYNDGQTMCDTIIGIQTTDTGASQYWTDIVFRNFRSNEYRFAGGVTPFLNSKKLLEPRDRARNVTAVNSNLSMFFNTPYENHKQIVFQDLDGSATGNAIGGWFGSGVNAAFQHKGANCTIVSDPNMASLSSNPISAYCQHHSHNYFQLFMIVSALDYSKSFYNATGTSVQTQWTRGTDFGQLVMYHLGDTATRMEIIGATNGDTTGTWFQWRVNAQSRRWYVVRFAQNVVTPPSLKLVFNSTVFGEWTIVALPYPASAQPFNVNRLLNGASIPFGQASSIDAIIDNMVNLNSLSYFYDSKTELLYVPLRHFYDVITPAATLSETFGQVEYKPADLVVTVQASCVKEECATAAAKSGFPLSAMTANPAIPAIKHWEDEYQGSTKGLSQSAQLKHPNYNIKSYAFMDVRNKSLHLTTLHTVRPEHAQKVELTKLRKDFSYITMATYPTRLAPSRHVVPLAASDWVCLVKGKLFVRVTLVDGTSLYERLLCSQPSCQVPSAEGSNVAHITSDCDDDIVINAAGLSTISLSLVLLLASVLLLAIF